jgi:hypothetical protein
MFITLSNKQLRQSKVQASCTREQHTNFETLQLQTHTTLACRVPFPFHVSCTVCIVGVARATPTTYLTDEHPDEISHGSPEDLKCGETEPQCPPRAPNDMVDTLDAWTFLSKWLVSTVV